MRRSIRSFIISIGFVCLSGCSPVQTKPIRLAFVGDLMLGRQVEVIKQDMGWEGTFDVLKPELQSADLAFGNLESPLCENGQSCTMCGNSLCASSNAADILTDAGFDVLSTANNHRLDCGPLKNKQAALERSGIQVLSDSNKAVKTKLKGKELTLLAFDDISSVVDENQVIRSIQKASSESDLVIVSIHWGIEYQCGPSQRQKSLAEKMAAAGADLIWGHHPHVLQPLAWIEQGAEQNDTLVAYSLGNALFDQSGLADTRRTALLVVDIHEDGSIEPTIIPAVIDPHTYNLRTADDKDKKEILLRLNAWEALSQDHFSTQK